MSIFLMSKQLPPLPGNAAGAPNGKYVKYSPSEKSLEAFSSDVVYNVWFRTKPLDEETINRMKSIQLTTESSGQGFCSDPDAGLWTWFEIAIMPHWSETPRIENGIVLTWKSHENSYEDVVTEKAGKIFNSSNRDDDAIFRFLKPGDTLAVRLCARFPQWTLYAKRALLVVELGDEETKPKTDLEQTVSTLGQAVSQVKIAQEAMKDINKLIFPHIKEGHLPSLPDTVFRADVVMEHNKAGSPPQGLRPLCVLALDGGGVRGLETLLVLQSIMKKAFPEGNVKPCQVFDMIGGTSTGGLIAIMLGRLEMDIDACINEYKGLMKTVFPPRFDASAMGKWIDVIPAPNLVKWGVKSLFTPINKVVHTAADAYYGASQLLTGAKWDDGKLEMVIKELIGKRLPWSENAADITLLDSKRTDGCKVFVTAVDVVGGNNQPPMILRSYQNPRQMSQIPNIKIWEAARATSAAPFYFKPLKVKVEDQGKEHEYEFVDGGLQANNPLGCLWNEVLTTYGIQRQTACFLSLGTGVPPSQTLPSLNFDIRHPLKQLKFINGLAGIACNTEFVNTLFQSLINAFAPNSGYRKYWRFNPGDGLGPETKKEAAIAMDDATKENEMTEAAVKYISSTKGAEMVAECAAALSSVGGPW
ncbi:acyl transferase/acyl hydrolase/lysophospholipase [Colletotrichum navitas]|uniref:Acyl transferase/acyl hydrolase/lysophospholipase n=1 Tax=Colletotrichum navitas TaxID=681940 RepID=A0AAD8V0L8_9PEZI|nr:acyl transferase/acyl hydrolase/lysophospholipase [Colletotrichum navitas]KAK1573420.1 acyl transferase/acyl hydrolase/lysophospholipase [Colletotrichum navitas]